MVRSKNYFLAIQNFDRANFFCTSRGSTATKNFECSQRIFCALLPTKNLYSCCKKNNLKICFRSTKAINSQKVYIFFRFCSAACCQACDTHKHIKQNAKFEGQYNNNNVFVHRISSTRSKLAFFLTKRKELICRHTIKWLNVCTFVRIFVIFHHIFADNLNLRDSCWISINAFLKSTLQWWILKIWQFKFMCAVMLKKRGN